MNEEGKKKGQKGRSLNKKRGHHKREMPDRGKKKTYRFSGARPAHRKRDSFEGLTENSKRIVKRRRKEPTISNRGSGCLEKTMGGKNFLSKVIQGGGSNAQIAIRGRGVHANREEKKSGRCFSKHGKEIIGSRPEKWFL